MGQVGNLNKLIRSIDQLTKALHDIKPIQKVNWHANAFVWRRLTNGGSLVPVFRLPQITMVDLIGIDEQKSAAEKNTRQFLQGKPANHMLLWGSRGTGKSSLVKALFNAYHPQGLRVIEVDKSHLNDLAEILSLIEKRSERYVLYCDDLSFEPGEQSFKELKVILDGSFAAPSDNVLIVATSNRRNLVPESIHDNQESRFHQGELHLSDILEEKLSLVERFGLRLSFHPFSQQIYLQTVDHWLEKMQLPSDQCALAHPTALKWALSRGSRSGRVAWQFAKYWIGEKLID